MKMFIAAAALAVAFPSAAFAQAAGHSAHGQHHGTDHSAHADHAQKGEEKPCCPHGKDGKMAECCAKAKREGKKMPCCDHKDGAHGDHKAAGHQGH